VECAISRRSGGSGPKKGASFSDHIPGHLSGNVWSGEPKQRQLNLNWEPTEKCRMFDGAPIGSKMCKNEKKKNNKM